MNGPTDIDRLRRSVLSACGAKEQTLEPLLAYTENPFTEAAQSTAKRLPLPDEPHVKCWQDYADEAADLGVLEALRRRFVQLRFPVQAGLSRDASYRRATREGVFEAAEGFSPLDLRRPEALELTIHPTIAGRVPVLIAAEREDFVSLVRVFACRNEPKNIPPSMGACIVTGFNNWDRIDRYRSEWERRQTGSVSELDWQQEFRGLIPRKELYQDRFIILSRGPYSATHAAEVGLGEEEWLAKSLVIRGEHEFTHYFTYRVFGSMRSNLHDELIADFVGLARAFGDYRAELALRFLGLESHPERRATGRLSNYRGDPPLSDEAMQVLQELAFRAIGNLDQFGQRYLDEPDDLGRLARLILCLTGLTTEELASEQMLLRAEARLA